MILKDRFESYLRMMDKDEPIRIVYVGTPINGLSYSEDKCQDLIVSSIKSIETVYKDYEVGGITFVEHINGPILYSWEKLYDAFVRNENYEILSFFLYGRYLDIFGIQDNIIQLYGSNGENPFEYHF